MAGALEAGKPDRGMIQVPNSDKTAAEVERPGNLTESHCHSDIVSTRNAHSIEIKTNKREGPKEKAAELPVSADSLPPEQTCVQQSSRNVHPPVP